MKKTVGTSAAQADGFYTSGETGTDFTYEADMKIADGNAAALVFRSEEDPYEGTYIVNINRESNPGEVKLFKLPYEVIATSRESISLDTWYNLKAVTSGDNIKIYLDDALVIDVNDSTYASGNFGLNVSNSTSLFQNVFEN